MKLAVITCYFDPDYVRARTLRTALGSLANVKLIVVKNKRTGLLRYPQIMWKILQTKRREKPDAYLITFRGYEILPFVLLLAGKKPVVFDEFIVPILSATNEGHPHTFVKSVHRFLSKVSEPLYRHWLKKARFVLADTQVHAELSARTSDMNLRKYVPVPVGADEKLFKPGTSKPREGFEVFYYGNMLPLHGLGTVLAAAELLKDKPDISFRIVGGKKAMRQAVATATANGAHIAYSQWLAFDELPEAMRSASLCLGGHFGNTQQAHHTIPGKTYQILACGAPVVAGASQATDEYFLDKHNALVVPQANPEALASAILWAQAHPAELSNIAANGRKLYEKEFSTAALARRLQPVVDAIS